METYRVTENMRSLKWNRMKYWRTELTIRKQVMREVKIKRVLFQEYSVSPLIFLLGMIPLSESLRKAKLRYNLESGKGKL